MRYKIEYRLRGSKGTFTTTPSPTFPSEEIAKLDRKYGNKIKSLIVLEDLEGADRPENAGRFTLHSIIK